MASGERSKRPVGIAVEQQGRGLGGWNFTEKGDTEVACSCKAGLTGVVLKLVEDPCIKGGDEECSQGSRVVRYEGWAFSLNWRGRPKPGGAPWRPVGRRVPHKGWAGR